MFQGTRQNVFVLNTVPNPSGLGNIDQAAFFDYTVKGWEIDLTATPNEKWIINANLTLQNPKITNYPQTPADVGNFVPSVPSVLANAWITYAFAMPPDIGPQWGPLKASFGTRYRNVEYADAGQTRIVPGVPLFDGPGWSRRSVTSLGGWASTISSIARTTSTPPAPAAARSRDRGALPMRASPLDGDALSEGAMRADVISR